MKMKLLAIALLAGCSMFAQTRFSVGIGIGGYGPAPGYYAPPPPAYVALPPCPGPGYAWVGGYWLRNSWVPGYWARRPYRAGFGVGFAPGFAPYRYHYWGDRGRHFNRGYGFRRR